MEVLFHRIEIKKGRNDRDPSATTLSLVLQRSGTKAAEGRSLRTDADKGCA